MYKKTMKMKAELEDVKLENAKLKEENQQTITPFELETEMKLRIFGLEEDLEKEKAKSAAKIGQMNSALHDKEAELDKIKLQLFNFYKSSGNLRLETASISKAEHDAQIAQLNKTHQSKIAELQKSIETLKNQNKRMNESCVKEKVQSVPKIGSMNAPLKSQTSELDEMNVSFSSKTDELKSETESRHLNARLSKLSKENVKFVDPIDLSQICILNDVIVGGKINYKKLNGKILDVKNLEYRNEKWFADGMEISFENSAFPILIKKHLYAKNLSSTILGRIFCHHLCSLSLLNTTLKFAEYRKLVSSPNLEEVQLLIIVKDENGNRIELDQVWKELSNVKKFE
uniref:Uncharacterized protein n=1 Tax=Panagrolaimus sp. ES5 TaxID=591445 RepID=A0AC34FRH0_9BILA